MNTTQTQTENKVSNKKIEKQILKAFRETYKNEEIEIDYADTDLETAYVMIGSDIQYIWEIGSEDDQMTFRSCYDVKLTDIIVKV